MCKMQVIETKALMSIPHHEAPAVFSRLLKQKLKPKHIHGSSGIHRRSNPSA